MKNCWQRILTLAAIAFVAAQTGCATAYVRTPFIDNDTVNGFPRKGGVYPACEVDSIAFYDIHNWFWESDLGDPRAADPMGFPFWCVGVLGFYAILGVEVCTSVVTDTVLYPIDAYLVHRQEKVESEPLTEAAPQP